jgi:8-oxo-dGTP pyrophosphatase MutT (NUDIX family)
MITENKISNTEINQVYRASIAAIIVNSKKEFLLVQNIGFRSDEWDFIKGGMQENEEEIDTLKREINEEAGQDIKYTILQKSICNIIYTWPRELQLKKGFRGQARVSFWVKYEEGEINIDPNEITAYQWVKEEDLVTTLRASTWPQETIDLLLFDWNNIKNAYFNN